jgi:replication factor C subunit 3/5
MSDYEDEMDVDSTAKGAAMQFSSNNTNSKGKKIVSDLPVGAEDNLPWCVTLRASKD